VLFKAGSWDGDRLLLCTGTEVLAVEPPSMRIAWHFSHPWMNDLHHVARVDGALCVVDTGLDALLRVDPGSGAVELRSALAEDPWARFDRGLDYRRVPTTKPHRAHPNFVFRTEHGPWLTRFVQRDAVCLDDPSRSIGIPAGHPHDGHVFADGVWFTTVNGHVVVADAASGRVVADHALDRIEAARQPLGWCRGLHREGDVVFVGFSRLRVTRWQETLLWLRRDVVGNLDDWSSLPTRVVAYDLRAGRKLAEWDVEPCGIQAIFSLLPAP
jgi:hypothetical protein